jgi:hypothetical protein
MIQDRLLLCAALRVLTSLEYRRATAASDIDLLRSRSLPEETDLDIDDLARAVAQRVMVRQPGGGRFRATRWSSGGPAEETAPYRRVFGMHLTCGKT